MRVDLEGANGIRLAGDVGGPDDGPTVVLLHGGGQTRHSWAGTWRTLVDAGWLNAVAFGLAALLLVAATRGRLSYFPDRPAHPAGGGRPVVAPSPDR